jgi:hypothetical protein
MIAPPWINAIEFVIKGVENIRSKCGKLGLNSDFLRYVIMRKSLWLEFWRFFHSQSLMSIEMDVKITFSTTNIAHNPLQFKPGF